MCCTTGRGQWVRADKLTPADDLMTSGGFGATVVREVKWRHLRRPFQVYNLVVSRVHNYLVGDGGIVVHNGSGTCTPNGPAADAADGGTKAADAAGNGGASGQSPDNAPKDTPPPSDAPKAIAGDLKTQSKHQLEKAGIDVEALKRDFVGPGSKKYNIAVDSNGQIVLVPVRLGQGQNVATGLTIADAAATYGAK